MTAEMKRSYDHDSKDASTMEMMMASMTKL